LLGFLNPIAALVLRTKCGVFGGSDKLESKHRMLF
jgi:hypothetical protein